MFAHEYRAQIIINDRVDIALALHADGVHLGQDDLWPDEARKILGPDAIIGFSTHSVEQASDALKLPVDYIAIGPIFGTSTKENPDPIVGPDGLHAVRKAIGEMPLVAIGGLLGVQARQPRAAVARQHRPNRALGHAQGLSDARRQCDAITDAGKFDPANAVHVVAV